VPQNLDVLNDHLTWHNALSFLKGEGWVAPIRLRAEDRPLYPESLFTRGSQGAGVRVSFKSNTAHLAGRMVPLAEEALVDLFIDGVFHGSVPVDSQGRFTFDHLPAREKTLQVWLPQSSIAKLCEWTLDDGATLTRADSDIRPRWITYGSSITHCKDAASPSQTWPAIVAREHNLNLTCLGYGGNCHLDPLIALLIRDMPADFISICAGVNIQGGSSLSKRTFSSMLAGFIRIIRDKHTHTPLVVISPIFCVKNDRETTPNAVGMTMQTMRSEAQRTVQALQSCGDRHIHYVSGLDLFNQDLAQYLPDGLHPNAEGYRLLARNFLKHAAEPYFVKA
jgi:lysophospholipase L1-like esterase